MLLTPSPTASLLPSATNLSQLFPLTMNPSQPVTKSASSTPSPPLPRTTVLAALWGIRKTSKEGHVDASSSPETAVRRSRRSQEPRARGLQVMERLREGARRRSGIGNEIEATWNGKSSLVEANNRPDSLRYHLPLDYKCLAPLRI